MSFIIKGSNIDVLLYGEVVGVIRLAFEGSECYIRDLQVSKSKQNQGVGSLALAECERLAIDFGVNRLKLRVFKISPAFRLYEKVGFEINDTDDRFFTMSRTIS